MAVLLHVHRRARRTALIKRGRKRASVSIEDEPMERPPTRALSGVTRPAIETGTQQKHQRWTDTRDTSLASTTISSSSSSHINTVAVALSVRAVGQRINQ